MATLEPVAMRLEVKVGRNGCTLINDSYNSDLASLDIALDFMHRRPDEKGRDKPDIPHPPVRACGSCGDPGAAGKGVRRRGG